MSAPDGSGSSADAAVVACRVVVDGMVQGVFFRDTCRRMAASVGVRGWVRNRPDGRVEAWFEGGPAGVARMVAWCREGPPGAWVTAVDVARATPVGETRFQVR